MSRTRPSDQLKVLQQQHLELRVQIAALNQAKRQLLLRQALLGCWCDSMSLLGVVSQQPDDPLDDDLEQWLSQEVELLQQLQGSDAAPQPPSLEGLLEPELATISPCTDPMAYLQRIASQRPLQEAATLTAEGLAASFQAAVLSVSLNLHKLSCLPPWDRPRKLQEIAGMWDRYMHLVVSCIMLGRQGVLERAHAINLESMQPEPAEAASHQQAQAAVLVPLLSLSEGQQEFIAVGMRLHADLLHSIHLERQKLQLQVACDAGRGTSSSGSGDGGSSAAASSPSSGHSRQLDTVLMRHSQLHLLVVQTNRLKLLLRKEYTLRMAAMGWLVGCLTYEQLSRLAVLSWPYPMRVLFLGNEIMQQRERLVQQRLQMIV